MLESIEKHVNSLSPFKRTFARYFTMTHLYNAGETTEALDAYQRALSKLVNSLSWGREVKRPESIDPKETIFYIDLRDYEWEIGTNRWTLIEQMYPYSIEFEAPTQKSLREKLVNLREEMNCEVPFVHVDWFIATASLPPLYHDILGIPETDQELETRLEVNVVENIRNAAGRRVWRAGFNNSGVSNHNRVLERHTSRYGAYWKSYDFAGSTGSKNVFTHPLSFTHDGGEIIFNLPNGLQAYLLVDAGGRRLDAAPIQIVRNLAASDPTVRNGLSCIGCHTEGMKAITDEVRGVAEKNPNPPFNKARVLSLYVEQATMDERLAEDTARYRQALEKTGDVFGGIEPVQRLHEAFQRPLDVSQAAASVGLETVDFLQKVRQHTRRLRVKPPGNLLPIAELINLETFFYWGSDEPVPDLSPLTKLPKLAKIDLGRGSKVDLSPLSELTTIKELWLHDCGISNLSFLEKLTTLERAHLGRNDISDISALSALPNLKWLDLSNNQISDFSPLDGVRDQIKLIWYNNPGFSGGGPKIEGPWLWAVLPDVDVTNHRWSLLQRDLLSEVSGAKVTEAEIAAKGPTEGKSVGSSVWTSHKLPSTGRMEDMLKPPVPGGAIYGSVLLFSPREQVTRLYVGSPSELQVWLNGTLIHQRDTREGETLIIRMITV